LRRSDCSSLTKLHVQEQDMQEVRYMT
jgi:hypothetical protein